MPAEVPNYSGQRREEEADHQNQQHPALHQIPTNNEIKQIKSQDDL